MGLFSRKKKTTKEEESLEDKGSKTAKVISTDNSSLFSSFKSSNKTMAS